MPENLIRVLIYLDRETNARLNFLCGYYGLSKMHLAGDFVRQGVEGMYAATLAMIEAVQDEGGSPDEGKSECLPEERG
jgi:hypothetical protein